MVIEEEGKLRFIGSMTPDRAPQALGQLLSAIVCRDSDRDSTMWQVVLVSPRPPEMGFVADCQRCGAWHALQRVHMQLPGIEHFLICSVRMPAELTQGCTAELTAGTC